MEQEKTKSNAGLIILLVLVILGLVGYIVYDKVLSKDEPETGEVTDQNNNGENQNTTYKVYKKGEELTLSDGSKWLVISDSDETMDYVTVLSSKDYSEDGITEYESISNEIYSTEVYTENWYNNSKIKEFLTSKIATIPVTLKEVNGNKIRLITVQEILDFDNKWEYKEERDDYNYTGNTFNQYFKALLTMTPSKCQNKSTAGKCAPLYNTGSTNTEHFISHWLLGVGGLNPVINIEKSSLQ